MATTATASSGGAGSPGGRTSDGEKGRHATEKGDVAEDVVREKGATATEDPRAPADKATPTNTTVASARDNDGDNSLLTTKAGSLMANGNANSSAYSKSANGKLSKPTKKKTKDKTEKSSFWSSFIRSFIPCISPKAHDLDLELVQEKGKKPPVARGASQRTAPISEKERPKSSSPSKKQKEPEPDYDGRPTPIDTELPLTTTHTAPPTPIQDPEGRIIVPPTPPSHILPRDETGGVTSGAVQPPGSTGDAHREHGDESYEDEEGDITHDSSTTGNLLTEEEEEERLILQGGAGIPIGPDGEPRPLLPELYPAHKGRKCLVLDLDETLVHSSFKLIPQADYVVPVEIEHQYHNVYVIKRPGVDAFLKKMGELYEIVVFTASLSKYADPVLDKLDISKVVTHRLFRESCYNHKGNYVKDLSQLGRPISQTIILDNSPASYIFHPNNAVPVSSWFNDPHDTELTDLCPFLDDLKNVDDVRGILDGGL